MFKPRFFLLLFFLAMGQSAQRAHAYNFTPTDAEWQSWPDHCKAKYVWNIVGQRSKWVHQITDAQRQQMKTWEDARIAGIHHYCTGTLWLRRALIESDPRKRASALHSALDETSFTYGGSSGRSSPLFAKVATQQARILYEQGKIEQALQVIIDTIAMQPTTDILYSAAATMQRKLGQKVEAKNTLERGLAAVPGESAEINYNLGLICLELGEVDDAVRYAEKAYKLGFPLPGLRSKLRKLGKM